MQILLFKKLLTIIYLWFLISTKCFDNVKCYLNCLILFICISENSNPTANIHHDQTNFSAFLFFLILTHTFGQTLKIKTSIDSLISEKTNQPFNELILISHAEKVAYAKAFGYADLEKKDTLKFYHQLVIGSISKQFTTVLVLQEFDKGNFDLFSPISTYLPNINQSWADTVNIHHLLCHMHGIIELNEAALFKAGTQYAYSQIGYDLLAKIIEKTSRKTFAELSKKLFEKCGMNSTFHPDIISY